MALCAMCHRLLDFPGDPMSLDCGGDCWGCIGAIEAKGGYQPSIDAVESEIRDGWREESGTAKRPRS
jgi:hypothetical protein